MPDLSDNLFLGRTADEMGDRTQEEVNEDLLYFHDQKTLIEAIPSRISKYEIKELFSRIGNNEEFFLVLLREIARVYKIENLKLFLAPAFAVSDPGDPGNSIASINNIGKLYYNLKVTVPNLIINKKFDEETTRDHFEKVINENKRISPLLQWVIKYLDRSGWDVFKREIFRQEALPMPE